MSCLGFVTWNPDPDIFNLGFFALRWYSLCFALAFVASYLILKRHFTHLDKRQNSWIN